jgi:hypothetical protein
VHREPLERRLPESDADIGLLVTDAQHRPLRVQYVHEWVVGVLHVARVGPDDVVADPDVLPAHDQWLGRPLGEEPPSALANVRVAGVHTEEYGGVDDRLSSHCW